MGDDRREKRRERGWGVNVNEVCVCVCDFEKVEAGKVGRR